MIIMKTDLYNLQGEKTGTIELPEKIFNIKINEDVIYQVVNVQITNSRQNLAHTKNRSDVKGGGKKPWRQKGTGRARSGSSRSPVWRKGGTVFGPHPRDYSYSVPRKIRKKALISALSMKFKENKMVILKDFPMEKISTRVFQKVVDLFDLKKALFVLADNNEVLLKSSRNIRNVKMIRSEGINVYDILNYEHLILLEPSVKKIEGALLI